MNYPAKLPAPLSPEHHFMPRILALLIPVLLIALVAPAHGEETPLAQPWDYAAAMRQIAAKADARPGVVLHVGDSITYSNPYGQWARLGAGRTAEDQAVLNWMHTGKDDDTDGWWLCRFDHPDGGRSHTACGGITAQEMLAGGRQKMPPFAELLKTYRPQIVVLMLGTNDASTSRPVADYLRNMSALVDLCLRQGVVCILSTIPPHPRQTKLAASYNIGLRKLAQARKLPLIDFEQEIQIRRPNDWNGTLLNRDDVHPTGENAGAEPTAENLRASGYLLRGWLSVRKIAEVKRTVLDHLPQAATPRPTAEAQRIVVIQGRDRVRDALIDPAQADRTLGAVPRDNTLRRADVSSALLVRFELAKLDIPATRLARAQLSFFVWDPSVRGRTKVCALALKNPWDEATACWNHPAAGNSWAGGAFAYGADTAATGPSVIVEPEQGSDTADPPIEYKLDMTELVRGWLDGKPNLGVAIAPVADRSVDQGEQSRFQVYASEHSDTKYSPRLTLEVLPP